MIELMTSQLRPKVPAVETKCQKDRLRTRPCTAGCLHMVALSIAMFAGIMPIVVELSSGGGDGAAATGGDRENRDDGKIDTRYTFLSPPFMVFSFSQGR